MTRIFHGCDDLSGGWSRVLDLCDTLEVTPELLNNASQKTLRRWRAETPKGFCFALHVDAGIVTLLTEGGTGATLDEAIARTAERADDLAARAIVLRLPPSFSPSASNKANLRLVTDRMRDGANAGAGKRRALILETQGLWDAAATIETAETLGAVPAIDPFLATQDGVTLGGHDVCFLIRERAALRRKFDQYDFEELLNWAHLYQRAFLFLRGRFCWDHARELHHAMRYLDDDLI